MKPETAELVSYRRTRAHESLAEARLLLANDRVELQFPELSPARSASPIPRSAGRTSYRSVRERTLCAMVGPPPGTIMHTWFPPIRKPPDANRPSA